MPQKEIQHLGPGQTTISCTSTASEAYAEVSIPDMVLELESAVQCLYGRIKDDGLGKECECDDGVVPGSTTCDSCNIGFRIFNAEVNATCLPCGVGEVNPETNQPSCVPCEVSTAIC